MKMWKFKKAIEDNVYLIIDVRGNQLARFVGVNAKRNAMLASVAPELLNITEILLREHYPYDHPFWESYGKDENHTACKARRLIEQINKDF